MAAPVPSVTVSRSSGVAPLAVFFDASATTDEDTSIPFHDLLYRWSFGDPDAGNWENGISSLSGINPLSKNGAFGPEAAHVYETAGTYIWTLAVSDGTTTVTTTGTITVTAADTQWATTKTICLSTSGNFTGAPAGATQVTYTGASSITNNLAADRRLLFCRGETFNLTTAVNITQNGPGMFGAYGSGAKPIINSAVNNIGFNVSTNAVTGTNMADWRFVDLVFDGNDGASATGFGHSGPVNNVLYLRCEFERVKNGVLATVSTLEVQNGGGFVAPIWDGLFVQDCRVGPLVPTEDNGGNGLYLSAARMAVLGNLIDNELGSEHGIRTAFIDRGVLSHNTVTGIPSGRAFMTLRSPEQDLVTFSGGGYPAPYYSEEFVVSFNYCYGGETTGQSGFGPVNQSADGLCQNVIWENNYQVSSATTNNLLFTQAYFVTIRNNVFQGLGAGTAFISTTGYDVGVGYADPTDVYIYNNSFYSPGTGSQLVFQETSFTTTGVATTILKNNLMYTPNDNSGRGAIFSAPDIVVTTGGNSSNAESTATTPFSENPTTLSEYKIPANSYATDGGTATGVPVSASGNDLFNGFDLTGDNRIGAAGPASQFSYRSVP